MREAVIVSTARTPIGKAYRGAFNNTGSQALAGHALKHAAERAKIDPAEVEDVIAGAALQQGHGVPERRASGRVARGLPLRRFRHEHRPPVRVGHDGDRDRCKAGDLR